MNLINMPRAAWKRLPTNPGAIIKKQGLFSAVTPYGFIDNKREAYPYKFAVGSDYVGHYIKSGASSPCSPAIYNFIEQNHAAAFTFVGVIRPLVVSATASSIVVICKFSNLSYYAFRLISGDGTTAQITIDSLIGGSGGYIYSANELINVVITCKRSSYLYMFVNGSLVLSATDFNSSYGGTNQLGIAGNNSAATSIYLAAFFKDSFSLGESYDLSINPWKLFHDNTPRFISIPSGGGAATYTAALSVDALIQRAGLTHSTHLDALLQSAFSKSLSLDSMIAAVQAQTISLDALLQIAGTRTITIDALLQATKSDVISIDALVQMTLAQSLSLDALIVAMGSASSSTNLDALIQSLKTAGVSLDALLSTSAMQSVLLDALLQSSKTSFVSLDGLIQAAEMQTLSLDALVQAVQSGTISLDALLSKSNISTIVIDALIQSSKTGAVSFDALITGASSASVFTGLDALIQAIQSKTISLDALLQKSYTSPFALDAYVALTQVKTMSLDALLQSMKSGVISMDAILQMTKTAMVSFDALIQAAQIGVINLDAILVFATQASVLLDAYVQKTLARGVGLDAIIGSIADMILPTGRVITVPASDRFVFVTHSDRVIQIQ